jgi:hypothetical protein
MAGSAEPYLFISDAMQSPFNIGTSFRLPDFNIEQVTQLNEKHGAPLNKYNLQQCLNLLGGHPYLTRKALHALVVEKMSWGELIETASDDYGPFSNHLYWYRILVSNEEVRLALKKFIKNKTCDEDIAQRMCDAGILKREKDVYEFRCNLYRQYFEQKFL